MELISIEFGQTFISTFITIIMYYNVYIYIKRSVDLSRASRERFFKSTSEPYHAVQKDEKKEL